MDPIQAPLSCRPPSVPKSPSPPYKPTNDDIEAVIQMATSGRPSPDGRPVPPRDTRTQLFVGNLPYRVRWQDLKDLFRRAGTVLRADVSLGPDNRSRGYGTVLLATAEDAGRAVDMFNGYSWQTRILEVRPDRLPPDLDNPLANVPIPTITGPASSPANPLLPPIVHGPSSQSNLHKRSDDFDIGSLLGINDLVPASNSIGRSLFVGNLPFHCQWQDLKDLFRQAGTVVRADVALGPDGRSRGFGTVIFASEVDAERARKIFNGYEYNGRILKVHVDKFTQSGQTISYPTSPSLHSAHATPSLTSMALDNLDNASSLAGSYSSQVSQVKLPLVYRLDYGLRSRSSSSPELYQPSAPLPQQHLQLPLQTPQSSFTVDMSAITMSLHSTHLTGKTNAPLQEGSASESASTSTSGSASRASSASSSGTSKSATHHQHPHHPGPITLPPPPPVPFPLALHKLSAQNEMTPSAQTPVFNSPFLHHQQTAPMTPHGLPPITPSMPPFTFLPPSLPPHQYHSQAHGFPDTFGNQTFSLSPFNQSQMPSPLDHPPSPYSAPYTHPGFSPGVAMSPGSFWGPPGNPNPHINPTVGAPVHAPTSPGRYALSMPSPNSLGRKGEPTSYFDLEYFPRDGAQPSYVSSNLANEILREKDEYGTCGTHSRDAELDNKRDQQDGDLPNSINGLHDTNDIREERSTRADSQLSTESDSTASSTSSNW